MLQISSGDNSQQDLFTMSLAPSFLGHLLDALFLFSHFLHIFSGIAWEE